MGLTRQTPVLGPVQQSSFVVGHIPSEAFTTTRTLVRLIHLAVILTPGIDLLNYMTKGCSRSLLVVALFSPILQLLGVSLCTRPGVPGRWSEAIPASLLRRRTISASFVCLRRPLIPRAITAMLQRLLNVVISSRFLPGLISSNRRWCVPQKLSINRGPVVHFLGAVIRLMGHRLYNFLVL